MKRIEEYIKSIREFLNIKKRYTFDDKELFLVEDKSIEKMISTFLAVFLFLCCSIILQSYQINVHKDKVQSHCETIMLLQDSISIKRYNECELNLYTEIGNVVISKNIEPCNKESICEYIDYLYDLGIVWYPEVLKANCEIESGFGQSHVAKKYNNLFGMDHPNARKTLSLYKSGRFATFKNWKCSILDRVLWDYSVFNNKVPTEETYYLKMTNIYNHGGTIDYGKILMTNAKKYKTFEK